MLVIRQLAFRLRVDRVGFFTGFCLKNKADILFIVLTAEPVAQCSARREDHTCC